MPHIFTTGRYHFPAIMFIDVGDNLIILQEIRQKRFKKHDFPWEVLKRVKLSIEKKSNVRF